MRIGLTGASGFVGSRLAEEWRSAGHNVSALARSGPLSLEGLDAVVHLGGEPIAQRWTRGAKERIRRSRVESTRRIVEALRGARQRPGVFLCASAVGVYGSRGDELLDESSPLGSDFLAGVCRDWEEEAAAAAALGVRTASLRMGLVLGEGGALARMLPAFRFGVGGRIGDGRQWMSWIHIGDLVRLFTHALSQPELAGPVNATAPEPVTNAEFTAALAKTLRRPAILPIPAFALRVGFGEMSSILLDSQRAVPRAAGASGFQHRFPALGEALRDLLGRRS
jgi:hypothetical protein